MLKGRHLIDPMDFTTEELDEVIQLAKEMYQDPQKYAKVCEGKILAALFYEPSTRTKLSFESAMHRLGGAVIGFSDANTSSAAKGESVADAIRVVSNYADIAVMRHFKEGAPKIASMYSSIPVVNAGDGGHQHPTQTLTDLVTISTKKGSLSGLKVGLCGDLKFGRTVHSLIKALSMYENNSFVLISPKELKVPDYIKKEVLQRKNIPFKEVERLEEVIQELDVLYMTRVQRERFFNEEEYLRLKDSYVLDNKKMSLGKEDMIVLHPLPRNNEIAYEVDSEPRACYFEQTNFGVFSRMALIAKLLGVVE